MGKRVLFVVIALALFSMCSTASAAILIEVKWLGTAAGRDVMLEIDFDEDGTYDASKGGTVGSYELMVKTSPTNEFLLFAFCIEPDQSVDVNYNVYEVVQPEDSPVGTNWRTGPMGTERAQLIEELWYCCFDPSWTDGTYDSDDHDNAAGFGVALYELIYETQMTTTLGYDFDATDGFFRAQPVSGNPNPYGLIANDFLAQLTGDPGDYATLFSLVNRELQDFIVEVPEPGSIAMAGTGLLMLLGILRKRRK